MEKERVMLRLKKVMLNDKINMPNGLLEIIKKDIKSLLASYFEFDEVTLKVEVEADSKGLYDIVITAKAEKIKSPKFL